MPERPNGAVSKTVVSSNGHRGFKSHSLRHEGGSRCPPPGFRRVQVTHRGDRAAREATS